jgi:hypothetical protein
MTGKRLPERAPPIASANDGVLAKSTLFVGNCPAVWREFGFENSQLFSGQLPNAVARSTPGISLAENVRQFTDREPHRQPGSYRVHPSQTVRRKYAVSS